MGELLPLHYKLQQEALKTKLVVFLLHIYIIPELLSLFFYTFDAHCKFRAVSP